MSVEQYNLKRKLEREEYLLGGIKPSSKGYQQQFQLVKDLKIHLEFLDAMEKAKSSNSEEDQSQQTNIMKLEDYKTSESVDMKNPEAVKYAANQAGLSVSHYRACAESSRTYHRMAIEKWIKQHYDYKQNRIIR